MSNQQPPYGRPPQGPPGQPPYQGPPLQGQPPQGPPPQGPPPGYRQPGQPGQPGQQGQPGQPGQPPYQGPPPQGPPPQGRPPQQQPPQGQPPYQGPPQQYPGQQPPYQGQQPPYPGQQPPYPGQQPPPGYPPQQGYPGQQPYPGQQQYPGPQYSGGNRGKGPNKILLLAGGGLAAVAVLGAVLAFVFGGGDDKKVEQPLPATPTSAQPSNEPSTPAEDKGIDVAEGVRVTPAPGYLRKPLNKYTGVYLLKGGEAYFMVNAFKPGPGETPATEIKELFDAETKGLSQIKKSAPFVSTGSEGNVKYMTSQGYNAVSTSQNGTLNVVGLVGVIERKDGVLTVIQVYGRKDKAAGIQKAIAAMLDSVIKSQ